MSSIGHMTSRTLLKLTPSSRPGTPELASCLGKSLLCVLILHEWHVGSLRPLAFSPTTCHFSVLKGLSPIDRPHKLHTHITSTCSRSHLLWTICSDLWLVIVCSSTVFAAFPKRRESCGSLVIHTHCSPPRTKLNI